MSLAACRTFPLRLTRQAPAAKVTVVPPLVEADQAAWLIRALEARGAAFAPPIAPTEAHAAGVVRDGHFRAV